MERDSVLSLLEKEGEEVVKGSVRPKWAKPLEMEVKISKILVSV